MATRRPASASFPAATFRFLRALKTHNDRDWFRAHREDYETDVRTRALDFIREIAPHLAKVSPFFPAVARQSGGSLMRVHRDMRFARDGHPYKTNIGIQFRHERGRDIHAPGFYVHVEPGNCFLAAGLWRPDRQALTAIRQEILEHPEQWMSAIGQRRFRNRFALGGDRLKRLPRGVPPDAICAEDLKRLDFIASMDIPDKFFAETALARRVAGELARTAPLMQFLCGALDLDF